VLWLRSPVVHHHRHNHHHHQYRRAAATKFTLQVTTHTHTHTHTARPTALVRSVPCLAQSTRTVYLLLALTSQCCQPSAARNYSLKGVRSAPITSKKRSEAVQSAGQKNRPTAMITVQSSIREVSASNPKQVTATLLDCIHIRFN
jgi:hypothetical protein